jgi:hypothetical protein
MSVTPQLSIQWLFDHFECCQQRLPEARAVLMQFDGVAGVGIGPRQRNGRLEPEQICLIVYVNQKRSPADLQANQFIPREFGSVMIDVVEVGSRAMAMHNEFDNRWLADSSPAPDARKA